MIKNFYTTGDIARYCEVDINTIKRWIAKNEIKSFKTPAGHHRVLRHDFINFLKTHNYPVLFKNDMEPLIGIIDDNKSDLKLIKYWLKKKLNNEGFLTASNGFDGYNLIVNRNPQIVFLDILMPMQGGLEMLKTVRQNKKCPQPEFIIMTGFLNDQIKDELKRLKIKYILEKPLDKDKTMKLCHQILEQMPDLTDQGLGAAG